MTTTIKLKNGTGVPTAGALVQGEPAFDLTNKRLYTENAGGTVIEVGTNPSTLSVTGAATFGGAVDVTGTVTADGLTVQTTNGLSAVLESANSYQHLQFKNSGYIENYIDFTNRDFNITCDNVNRFTINGTNGNVGIGASSPVTLKSATTLQVSGNAKLGDDNGRGLLSLGDIISTGANVGIWRGAAGAYAGIGNYLNLGGYDGITFTTGAADISAQTERFRIASDGSLSTPTLGTSNVRFGVNAGNSITSGGNYNVVVGDEAGTAITTGAQNVAIGFEALSTATTASRNTAVGLQALKVNTGDDNSAFGYGALILNTTGTYNTAVGRNAGAAVTTGTQNTLIGGLAGDANTTGGENVAVGYGALTANTTASNNTAVGHQAGYSNTTGTNFTAIGQGAMYSNTTGNNSTAVGRSALYTNTTGASNSALGQGSLGLNSTGSNNSAFGADALNSNTTGTGNSALGKGSLSGNTTASYNTGLGENALLTNTTGASNTAVGNSALYANTTASYNTAVGTSALAANTTGASNTCLGDNAGSSITTGSHNVLIGRNTGVDTVALTTGGHNVVLGNFSRTNIADAYYAIGLGYNITAAEGYTTVGRDASDIRAAHGVATWATVSDERYKKDITDSTAGLSFINALRPRTFKYRTLGELPETFSAYKADSTEVFKNSETNHGFIAQEIKAAIDADASIKDGFRLWDDREDGSQEVAEAALIPILVKAIQELTARLEALEGAN
jgi:trimeric autotransporter adhesin